MKREIRKKLLEEKNKRQNKLIESKIVESRLKMIVESKSYFNSLTPRQQRKVFLEAVKEVNNLKSQGLINEGLGDIFSSLFGQKWSALAQSIIEPLVKNVLNWFGITGIFAETITQFIVSDPSRVVRALGDCREFSKLFAESISAGLVNNLLSQKGMDGVGYRIIMNAVGGAIKDDTFISTLSDKMSDSVCKLFGSFQDKAENVLNKIKGDNKPLVAGT